VLGSVCQYALSDPHHARSAWRAHLAVLGYPNLPDCRPDIGRLQAVGDALKSAIEAGTICTKTSKEADMKFEREINDTRGLRSICLAIAQSVLCRTKKGLGLSLGVMATMNPFVQPRPKTEMIECGKLKPNVLSIGYTVSHSGRLLGSRGRLPPIVLTLNLYKVTPMYCDITLHFAQTSR